MFTGGFCEAMTYSTTTHQGVVVEEYVTGRVLRITHKGQSFKFFAQSERKSGIAIYIGHGTLTAAIKRAIRAWASERGVTIGSWGKGKDLNNSKTV